MKKLISFPELMAACNWHVATDGMESMEACDFDHACLARKVGPREGFAECKPADCAIWKKLEPSGSGGRLPRGARSG